MTPRMWPLLALMLLLTAVWNLGQMPKRLAAVQTVELSPNGCYRLEILKPRWLLPAPLHAKPDPGDESAPAQWFALWDSPRFLRLYDHRNGHLIKETQVFDLTTSTFSGPIDFWYMPTRRERLLKGLIDIGPALADCAENYPAASGDPKIL